MLLKYSSLTCLEVLIASEKTIQLPEQWSLADRNKRKTYHLASHSEEDIHEKVSSFISFTTTSSISSKKYRTIWLFYNIIAVASCSVVIQLEVCEEKPIYELKQSCTLPFLSVFRNRPFQLQQWEVSLRYQIYHTTNINDTEEHNAVLWKWDQYSPQQ